jgi:DNA helicase-2/ATP-dependent DNA helicase PcrA
MVIKMEIDILKGLNEEQLEAVTQTEGYIRVIAGAGSGKTKALTNRYAYLVNDLGISTVSILCVTFTNKAANEMKKRIRDMLGDCDTGYVSTFHGFCVQLLREDIHTLSYPERFIVMDSEDTDTILKTIYKEAEIDSSRMTFNMAKDMIGGRKFKFEHIPYLIQLDIDELRESYHNSTRQEDRIFYGYLYEQRKCFGLDFDDLLTFAYHILSNFEEKLDKWQKKLEYVMVDEFQDVNELQYVLADMLSGYHKNLFVVGDPDQTIYTWRGAKVEYIIDFDKKYPAAKTVIMDKNYRSTPNILNASNSLIKKNKNRIEKELKPVKKEDIPVIYNHAKTVTDEAKWIVKQIRTLQDSGKSLSNIAILFRSNFVSRSLEEAFVREEIPYILYSGLEFYKRKEIKDILSYLRMIAFEDNLSFLRTVNEPKRNMGNKRIELIRSYAEEHRCTLYQSLKENMTEDLLVKSRANEYVSLIERYKQVYKELSVSDLLMAVLNDSGYEAMLRTSGQQERLDNLAELKQSIKEYENSTGEETNLEDYLQKISLFSNADQEERKNSIKMMTVHTAKGLEFPYVFVCGLNEGIFPSVHVNTTDKLEEERRLAYVAYTRAENALFLSDAEGLNYDGSYRYPSRFIFNTDKAYLDYTVELDDRLVDGANSYIASNEKKLQARSGVLFQAGVRVSHKTFGEGTVVEVNMTDNCYVVVFDNKETERSLSFHAPLVRL